MGKFYDITGIKYERLTVIKRIPNLPNSTTSRWLCVCDCGKEIESNKNNLINGHTKSCGCYAAEILKGNKYKETHNQSRTRLYYIWQSMKQRCYDKNVKEYCSYGGRGIKICDEWLTFEYFYEWANENGYKKDLSIDRKDNFKGYSPDNCRWATVKEQNRNKIENRIIKFNGVEKCVGEWCEIFKLPMSTVINRLNRGCSPEETLNVNYSRHG